MAGRLVLLTLSTELLQYIACPCSCYCHAHVSSSHRYRELGSTARNEMGAKLRCLSPLYNYLSKKIFRLLTYPPAGSENTTSYPNRGVFECPKENALRYAEFGEPEPASWRRRPRSERGN
ncbi:hypothetical protein GGR51DRAFT_118273 [Nemania sp. FL0031]|nr:hypothetical protein GGR51DRAFT_118273 [Nemania sp. FL0031]